MTHTLITFLGRTPKGQTGYRKTRYRFPDGIETPETAFIGWSLHERLYPDRMVILGTSGSMWDYLVESLPLGDESEAERLELQEVTENKAVTQPLLNQITPLLQNALGSELKLLIIPYGQQENEQIELLQLMAEQVPTNAHVSLDVTHGFRHLPMLALMSALHLRVTRNAQIAGIYYGAYDPDTGDAPIFDLSGLLRIADWVGALHTFDNDGDYSAFAPLLELDGIPSSESELLRKAAFSERTFNLAGASTALGSFEKNITADLPGISRLFTEQLRERLQWRKHPHLYARQCQLARFYLKQRDYPRAAIFAYEAFITGLVDKDAGEQELDYNDRESAEKAFLNGERGDPALKKPYLALEKLRNSLAHGNPPKDKRVKRIMNDEQQLRATLSDLMKRVLLN